MAARSHAQRSLAEGRLVIFISHRMGEVRTIADRLTDLPQRARPSRPHDAKQPSPDGEIVTQMIGRPLDRLYPERKPHRDRPASPSRSAASSSGTRLTGGRFRPPRRRSGGRRRPAGPLASASCSRRCSAPTAPTGSIELWGKPARIAHSPRRALVGRDGIALVPEDRRGQGLLLAKSGAREPDALRHPALHRARASSAAAKEAALVKPRWSTSSASRRGRPDQLAGTLSGGNQQKVIFGKMLLTEARVLLLFDPTRGVDVGTKGEIFQLMRDLAAKGYAILFYSSDLPELVHVADRVMVMRSGRIAATLEGDRISRGRHPPRRGAGRSGMTRSAADRRSRRPATQRRGRAAPARSTARLSSSRCVMLAAIVVDLRFDAARRVHAGRA